MCRWQLFTSFSVIGCRALFYNSISYVCGTHEHKHRAETQHDHSMITAGAEQAQGQGGGESAHGRALLCRIAAHNGQAGTLYIPPARAWRTAALRLRPTRSSSSSIAALETGGCCEEQHRDPLKTSAASSYALTLRRHIDYTSSDVSPLSQLPGRHLA